MTQRRRVIESDACSSERMPEDLDAGDTLRRPSFNALLTIVLLSTRLRHLVNKLTRIDISSKSAKQIGSTLVKRMIVYLLDWLVKLRRCEGFE